MLVSDYGRSKKFQIHPVRDLWMDYPLITDFLSSFPNNDTHLNHIGSEDRGCQCNPFSISGPCDRDDHTG
jgi:hypothetical protein